MENQGLGSLFLRADQEYEKKKQKTQTLLLKKTNNKTFDVKVLIFLSKLFLGSLWILHFGTLFIIVTVIQR